MRSAAVVVMGARVAGRRPSRWAFSRPGLSLAAALALGGLSSAPVVAEDTVFTMGNYPVEARADNAVAAKEKAMAEGQRAALHSLLKRLVPVTAYPRLKALDSVNAGDLIEGFGVRAERNSLTEYIANLDFSFQADGVRGLLRQQGIPFVDEQAPPVTLVPVWRSSATAPPADDAGWTAAWRGLDLSHALTPVKLAAYKPEIRPETVAALAGGDGSAIRDFASLYNSEFVLMAVAEPDAASGRLIVTLAGRDVVGAFALRRAYRVDPGDPAYTKEYAAVVGLGVLQGRWKSIKTQGNGGAYGGASSGGDLMIYVQFRGMSEWQDISRRLGATPGVQGLDVAGLSARNARVTLRYARGAEELAAVLEGQGLSLRNDGGNWILQLR
jgi:hypothetical protein